MFDRLTHEAQELMAKSQEILMRYHQFHVAPSAAGFDSSGEGLPYGPALGTGCRARLADTPGSVCGPRDRPVLFVVGTGRRCRRDRPQGLKSKPHSARLRCIPKENGYVRT